MTHLHLDLLGGLAGDMFAACMLDAFPAELQAVADAAARAAPVHCSLLPHDDGVLTGCRFVVTENDHHHHHHAHAAWRDLRAGLERCGLEPAAAIHAIGIFTVLAEAEARVHGCAPDAVQFHEVGHADSIADIVAAATLIARFEDASWSVSPVPLGSGRIATAHGIMPVPAPATALLLDGFATVSDGIEGERVTPTGAAILAYLRHAGRLVPRPAGTLNGTGLGFGTRIMPGISNCVRVLVLDTATAAADPAHRSLGMIQFEVDDQSPEDLAIGLDRIRALDGVHDVVQLMAFGKKGRLTIQVQVLVAPDALETAVAACFDQTTTIGLRTHFVQGRALPRRSITTEIDGVAIAVKRVARPHGETGKAESDHVAHGTHHAERAELRRRAERAT